MRDQRQVVWGIHHSSHYPGMGTKPHCQLYISRSNKTLAKAKWKKNTSGILLQVSRLTRTIKKLLYITATISLDMHGYKMKTRSHMVHH